MPESVSCLRRVSLQRERVAAEETMEISHDSQAMESERESLLADLLK